MISIPECRSFGALCIVRLCHSSRRAPDRFRYLSAYSESILATRQQTQSPTIASMPYVVCRLPFASSAVQARPRLVVAPDGDDAGRDGRVSGSLGRDRESRRLDSSVRPTDAEVAYRRPLVRSLVCLWSVETKDKCGEMHAVTWS
jgi:hypothetical protein